MKGEVVEINTNADLINNLLPYIKYLLKDGFKDSMDIRSFEFNKDYQLKIIFKPYQDKIVITHADLNILKVNVDER